MMGFIGSFENMARGILGQAMHGSMQGGQRVQTRIVRQTSRGSIDRLILALREARSERDRAVRERDALRLEVDRYRRMLARPAGR